MSKYVLFFPSGGLNGLLGCLESVINYCKKVNRILLFDMKNTLYNINFADYFDILDSFIIYDSNEIKNIILNNHFYNIS